MTVLFFLTPPIFFPYLIALAAAENVESPKTDELSIYGQILANKQHHKPMKKGK